MADTSTSINRHNPRAASPAKAREMPYTGVIERPDLQEILLDGLAEGVVQNGVGIDHYTNECAVDEKTMALPSALMWGNVSSALSL